MISGRLDCIRAAIVVVLGICVVPQMASGQVRQDAPFLAGPTLDIEPLATLTDVIPMAVSDDGDQLFLYAENGSIARYDVATAQTTPLLRGSQWGAIAPSENWFAIRAPNEDRPTVNLYDLSTGELYSTYPFDHPDGHPQLLFSPDANWIAVYSDNRRRDQAGQLDVVRVGGDARLPIEIPRLELEESTDQWFGKVAAMAFDPGRGRLGIAWDFYEADPFRGPETYDVQFDIVDLHTGEIVREFQDTQTVKISSLVFSPDGRFLIAGTRRRARTDHHDFDSPFAYTDLYVVDTSSFSDSPARDRDGPTRANFGAGYGMQLTVAAAPNGRLLYTTTWNQVSVWTVDAWREFTALCAIPLEETGDTTMILSPDGSTLVTWQGFSTADKVTAQIWDVSDIESLAATAAAVRAENSGTESDPQRISRDPFHDSPDTQRHGPALDTSALNGGFS